MIAIETKQNELDVKFTSMLDNQQAHIQALIDMKIIFFELLGSQKDRTNLVLFPKANLALTNNNNHMLCFLKRPLT
jgi:hypothetical protein